MDMSDDLDRLIEFGEGEKASLVEKQATCPFLGSAIAQGDLAVRNDVENPLARIEDVRRLGNTSGGNLGNLLVWFAKGNHAFMLGDSGTLDQPVPNDLFSLVLPGSQGSHPGHSGILEGDPAIPGSGRLSKGDFERLTSRAKEGWIKRSDVGRFIAENLRSDQKSKVFSLRMFVLLARDVVTLIGAALSALAIRLFRSDGAARTAHRAIKIKLTRLLGENNLLGSSGEFGLLFAFLAKRPGAKRVGGQPALAVDDLQAMFVDKRLPDGWETWKKTWPNWLKNTTSLAISAFWAYCTPKRAQ